ncbi:MAG: hypothetical protein QM763_13400 [Agriterribacter sp.]
MKTALKISNVLSWINIIIGGILVLGGLIGVLMSGSLAAILSVVLVGSIVLHSYACFQLRKSILNPEILLSTQTSGGIRMVGYIALFFAVMYITSAIISLQDPYEVAKQINLPFKVEGFDIVSIVRITGIFALLFGLSITANVMLSFQLLRWYTANNNNQKAQ